MFNTWLASVIMYSYNFERKANKKKKKILGVISINTFKEFDIIKKKFMRNILIIWVKISIFFKKMKKYIHKKKEINLTEIKKKDI